MDFYLEKSWGPPHYKIKKSFSTTNTDVTTVSKSVPKTSH